MNLNEYKRIKARKLGVAILKKRVLYLRRSGGDDSQLNSEMVNLRHGINDVNICRFFCHNMINQCTHLLATTKIV